MTAITHHPPPPRSVRNQGACVRIQETMVSLMSLELFVQLPGYLSGIRSGNSLPLTRTRSNKLDVVPVFLVRDVPDQQFELIGVGGM